MVVALKVIIFIVSENAVLLNVMDTTTFGSFRFASGLVATFLRDVPRFAAPVTILLPVITFATSFVALLALVAFSRGLSRFVGRITPASLLGMARFSAHGTFQPVKSDSGNIHRITS